MSTGRVTGPNNHAGDLAPLTSPWGQFYIASESLFIAQPPPIGRQRHGFWGTVGAAGQRSASVIPLVADGGYFGDVPLDQQDSVNAPDPWDRP